MPLHVLLVGASGVGKNTILNAARNDVSFASPVACTTRNARDGEVDGVNYHFITPEEFQRRADAGLFAEHAKYGNSRYGKLDADLRALLNENERVIYDIEIQGARQIKAKFPDAFVVFVIPPSMDKLRERILADPKRNHTPEELEQRLATGREELQAAYELADFVMVNDRVDHAVAHFVGFIRHLEDAIRNQDIRDFSARNRHLLDRCLTASS